MSHSLELKCLADRLAVCRLEPRSAVPDWVPDTGFASVTRTAGELSLVVPEERVPPDVRAESGWRALEVRGPLDFSLIGVLASLTAPLASAEVSLLAISTFDTDYVLVRDDRLADALAALRGAGHRVTE